MWFSKLKEIEKDPFDKFDIELTYKPKEDISAYELSKILTEISLPQSNC